MVPKALRVVERVVPKTDSVVLRTFPDLSDEGIELVEAMARRHCPVPIWLVDGDRDPAFDALPCRTLRTKSAAGLLAFMRAKVVIHTHGVFGAERFSPAKRFVNIWHGMPVKHLEAGSAVGRNQTDVTIATAPVHAQHLAETWRLSLGQVAITGLPRNDVLARPPATAPAWLTDTLAGRPLVVWLPTFRTAVVGVRRSDGCDLGTETQFAGADLATVDQLMGVLGAHVVIKPHPLGAPPARVEMDNVTVLGQADLVDLKITLYGLLSHASVLITDHSSVWIDFLLTGRPVVFGISDRHEYAAGRGYYFDDLDALLPGPIVDGVDGLRRALEAVLRDGPGEDPWAEARSESLGFHHRHVDAQSADRVAELIERHRTG